MRGDGHQIFATHASLSPEEAALGASDDPGPVVAKIREHVSLGAMVAQELGLPAEAVEAISTHHEAWDGGGYPNMLGGDAIPIIARILALADHIESLIDQTSPLQARYNLAYCLTPLSGTLAEPRVSQALRALAGEDVFWLGLYSADLAGELVATCGRLHEPKSAGLLPVAEALAQLVDSRFSFTIGVSERVTQLAEALGRAAGLDDQRLRLLHLASLLHDVGQLSVSDRALAKPGIFSVDELEVLHLHPHYSSEIVAGIAGLDEVASWVAVHHERPDGKGYPEGLAGDAIAFEARILAVVDTHVAMTSDRPYRPRIERGLYTILPARPLALLGLRRLLLHGAY